MEKNFTDPKSMLNGRREVADLIRTKFETINVLNVEKGVIMHETADHEGEEAPIEAAIVIALHAVIEATEATVALIVAVAAARAVAIEATAVNLAVHPRPAAVDARASTARRVVVAAEAEAADEARAGAHPEAQPRRRQTPMEAAIRRRAAAAAAAKRRPVPTTMEAAAARAQSEIPVSRHPQADRILPEEDPTKTGPLEFVFFSPHGIFLSLFCSRNSLQ